MLKDTKSPFLLSYHDVSVANFRQVREDLALLGQWGFPHWTLLVIPHCSADQLPEFQDMLQEMKDQGHELCLHGFKHKQNIESERSLGGQLALRLTAGEAEFAGLKLADSKALLEEAIRAWDRLGIGRAEGFVPPTWWAPEHLADLALAVGWTFYEERFAVHFQTGNGRFQVGSIPVSFAGMPTSVHFGLATLGKYLVPRMPGVPRLVLHPGELAGSLGERIRTILEAWLKWGNPESYAELSRKKGDNSP